MNTEMIFGKPHKYQRTVSEMDQQRGDASSLAWYLYAKTLGLDQHPLLKEGRGCVGNNQKSNSKIGTSLVAAMALGKGLNYYDLVLNHGQNAIDR